jgi:hypothetical protein
MWAPDHDFEGVIRSLLAVFDFSFFPNDWSKFHGKRPVFGSLYTLLIPVLFFLRKSIRIWALVGWISVATFTWYWVHHQDRYLQAIVPLMAACTAATLILVFRQQRILVRRLVALLVGLQIALGADVYFIPTHAMTGSAVKRSVELLGMGHQGKYSERFVVEPRWVALSYAIPKEARVLFHDVHTHLGTEREGVRDLALWQSGITYSEAKSPNDVYRWYKEMGVSHIVTIGGKSTGTDRLASDLIFYDFVYRRATRLDDVEGLHVFEMPQGPSTLPFRDKAVVASCGTENSYELYPLKALARPSIGPLSRIRHPPIASTSNVNDVSRWYPEVDFVVVGAKCEALSGLTPQFKKVAERPKRGSVPACTLYVRNDGISSNRAMRSSSTKSTPPSEESSEATSADALGPQ